MDKASGKDKPPQFSIIPATPDDIPSFAELLADTLGRSSLMRSLVLDSDKRDFVVGLYKYRIETPLTKEEYKVFKAVSNQGQLMGSIAISHETGELCRDGKGTKRGEEIRNTPSFPGLRNELLRELLTGMGTLYDGLRGPHWCESPSSLAGPGGSLAPYCLWTCHAWVIPRPSFALTLPSQTSNCWPSIPHFSAEG